MAKKKKRSGFGLFVALVVGGVVGYKIRAGLELGNGNGSQNPGEFDEQERDRQLEDRLRRLEHDRERQWREYG